MSENDVLDSAAPVERWDGNNGAMMEALSLAEKMEIPPANLQTTTDPNLVCPKMLKADRLLQKALVTLLLLTCFISVGDLEHPN